jgi:hypothetical protein
MDMAFQETPGKKIDQIVMREGAHHGTRDACAPQDRLPNYRKVLECASPLALLEGMACLKAAEDCRTPRCYRDY